MLHENAISDASESEGPNIAELLETNEAFSEIESDSVEATANPATPAAPPQYTLMMSMMSVSESIIKLAITEAARQSHGVSGDPSVGAGGPGRARRD